MPVTSSRPLTEGQQRQMRAGWRRADGRAFNEKPELKIDGRDGGFYVQALYARREIPKQAGFRHDRGDRHVAMNVYQIKGMWHYADDRADAYLREAFPGETRPSKPPQWPMIFRDADEQGLVAVGCLDFKTMLEKDGWIWDNKRFLWKTNDIATAFKYESRAEPALRPVLKRLRKAVETRGKRLRGAQLPFDALGQVTMKDLFELIDEDPAGGGGGEEALRAFEGERPPPLLDIATVALPGRDKPAKVFRCLSPEVARAAGFREIQGRWITSDVNVALQVRHDCTDEAELTIQQLLAKKLGGVANDNVQVPAPEGKSYKDYQITGILFMASRAACLLGDEMGTGKTVQAAGLINYLRPKRTLVAAPAFLVLNWVDELEAWLVPGISVGVLTSAGAPIPDTDVVIVSYDIMFDADCLRVDVWDLFVCDEAHYLKNERSYRTRAVLGDRRVMARRRVYMTGTPIFNRPQDLWTIVHDIAPDVFPSRATFMRLYKVTSVEVAEKAMKSILMRLGTILRSGIMLRRLKADILKDLPPKRRHLMPVLIDERQRRALALRSNEIENELRIRGAEVAAEMDFGGAWRNGKLALGKSDLLARLGQLRKDLGDAKLAEVLAFADNLVQTTDEPFIIFTYHKDLARRIEAHMRLRNVPVDILTGDTPKRQRQDLVRAFQRGEGRVLVCTLDAAGTGLTMTRARIVLFAEIDWSPSKLFQSEDRVHRVSQVREVDIYYFVVPETLDARVATVVSAKANVAGMALFDTEANNNDEQDFEADVAELAGWLTQQAA